MQQSLFTYLFTYLVTMAISDFHSSPL